MKKFLLVLTSTILALSSSAAFAQQQYDSLGMPTPRPNQSASPNEKAPNVPIPAGQQDTSKENPSAAGTPVESSAGGAQTTGSGSSADSASGANPATGGDNQPADAGMAGSKSSPTSDPTETPNQNGVTPSGITPD